MELVGIAQQLPLFQPAGIDEEMVFDAGERMSEFVFLEGRTGGRLRQKGDRLPLPDAPGPGRRKPRRTVLACQAAVIGRIISWRSSGGIGATKRSHFSGNISETPN